MNQAYKLQLKGAKFEAGKAWKNLPDREDTDASRENLLKSILYLEGLEDVLKRMEREGSLKRIVKGFDYAQAKRIREDLGITQVQLIQQICPDKPANSCSTRISSYETGLRNPKNGKGFAKAYLAWLEEHGYSE